MKIEQGKMRILLACADESLLKQTKRLMQASNELELVGCTSNGTKAWEMIRQKTPDMVVLDTDLPYADGFAVASWMRQNKMWDTSIILLSSFIGGQTYVECSLLHINVLLRKPICADALYERIKLAVTCTSRGDTVEQRLAQILRELGMREHTIGYQCALLTVCLYRETNGASITKIIYHSVAQQLNSEGGNVERNMRYAVHRAWDKCDKAVLAGISVKRVHRIRSRRATANSVQLSWSISGRKPAACNRTACAFCKCGRYRVADRQLLAG